MTFTKKDAYHRTFLPVWEDGAGAGAEPVRFDKSYQPAWVFDQQLPLQPTMIKVRKDQIFRKHCTNFEGVFSTLAGNDRVLPVVRPDGALIGHHGRFSGQSIWIPFQPRDKRGLVEGRGWLGTFEGLQECLLQQWQVVVVGAAGFTPWGASEQLVTVVVDSDGNILYPLKYEILGATPSMLQPADLIGPLLARALLGRAAAAVAEPLADEAVSVMRGVVSKSAGSVTIAEMEGFLADVIAKNPELAQLMRARAFQGQALENEAMAALRQWSTRTGKGFEFVENGSVQQVAGIGNYASVQGDKLLIERVVAESPSRLYAEAVHELSADALGVSGKTLTASQLPFIGERINALNNAFFILENGIKETGGIPQVMKDFF